jgi:solute carrier family 45, member 1/2/4
MTMVWAISPFLGFFLSPMLGSISDRCYSKFGRRRPLIFVLSICIIIGLIFAPMGKHIGEILGGDDEIDIFLNNSKMAGNFTGLDYQTVGFDSSYYLALSITIVGTLLLDFSAGKIIFCKFSIFNFN